MIYYVRILNDREFTKASLERK